MFKLLSKNNLHSPWVLLAGLGVGGSFFATIDGLLKQLLGGADYRLSMYSILLLLWVFYWEHNRSCSRRTTKGKIGFVVSIYAEEDHEEKRLKTDFVEELRSRIEGEGLSSLIDVNVLKNHVAEKTQTHEEIVRLNKRLKGRFYLHGKIKRRLDPANTYFLEINATVFHVPITQQNSEMLKRDIDAVLPKQIRFLETIEFKGFQYTTDSVYIAARYITGIAAFLSQDPILAQTLHSKLESDLLILGHLPPNLEEVKRRIPFLLSAEALSIAQAKFNNGDFVQAKGWLVKTFEKSQSNYPAMLLQSIMDFQVDNDAPKALVCMKNAIKHRGDDETVFYNLAFLQLWTGNYAEALRSCDRIASAKNPNDMFAVRQAQDFNADLLKQGKFRNQLYFWVGFLSYKKDENFPQAFEHLEQFILRATPDMNILVPRAQAYLDEIKKGMSIS